MANRPYSEWNSFIANLPHAHILQAPEWGKIKSSFGWKAERITVKGNVEIGAQILIRSIMPGIKMAYIPKGPVYDLAQQPEDSDWIQFWAEVDRHCRKNRIAFLKVEPDLWIRRESLRSKEVIYSSESRFAFMPEKNKDGYHAGSFKRSPHVIQPQRTIVIDLQDDEKTILAQMKQKTRYNIKLATRHQVIVEPSDEIERFYGLMRITGDRDSFGIHSLDYYKTIYEILSPVDNCLMLLAEHQGDTLAGLIVVKNSQRAWYFYGASNNLKRELMPSYLLQWEAIQWARAQGCLEYDLWGVPDFDLPYLEDHFTHRHDDLWGVYRFKRGFGGELRQSAGAWDRVYNPIIYTFYRWWRQRNKDSALTNT